MDTNDTPAPGLIRVFDHSGTVKLFLVCNDHIVPRNIDNNDNTHIFIQVGV